MILGASNGNLPRSLLNFSQGISLLWLRRLSQYRHAFAAYVQSVSSFR